MMTANKWKMDPAHSSVEFSIRHMMISTVKGNFRKFDLEFDGSLDDLENSRVKVTIDALSVDTGEEKRDAHLRSPDFFKTDEFPNITFQSRKIGRLSDEDYSIVGDLTIRGVTKEIELRGTYEGDLVDPYGVHRFGVTVNGEINRDDFGVSFNAVLETGGILLGSKVKFEVHAEITAA